MLLPPWSEREKEEKEERQRKGSRDKEKEAYGEKVGGIKERMEDGRNKGEEEERYILCPLLWISFRHSFEIGSIVYESLQYQVSNICSIVACDFLIAFVFTC